MDSRLRVGHAIGKTEEEIAPDLMKQVKMHAPDEGPPAVSSDGKGAYREAMLETWRKVPEYGGRGAPSKLPQPGKDWQCLQLMVRSFLEAIFTFVVLIRRELIHSQERQEQTFHRKMPFFSESTKSFFCENSGSSLDFILPKFGGE